MNQMTRFDIQAAKACTRDAIRCAKEGDELNAFLWKLERRRYMKIARLRAAQ